MNEEIMYEQEISLADILVRVLRKWKWAVLFSVIGAVILAGYVLLTTLNPKSERVMSATQIAEAEERLEEIDTLLTANEVAVEDQRVAIENMEDLIENNEMEVANKESEVKRLARNNEELKALEEIYQTAVDATLEANIVDEDFTSDVMALTVRIADAQHAVYDNESRIEAINIEIMSLEKEIEDTLPKEIKKIEHQMKTLDKEAKDLVVEKKELEEKMKETVTSRFSIVKVVVFAALGALVGLMGMCGCVVAILLFDKKIHNTQELEDNFGLHVLGIVSQGATAETKNFIDKWIDKLNGVDQNINADNEVEVIAAKIKTLSKTRKVMAIGTVDVKMIQILVDKLNKAGCDNGFELIVAGNPMYCVDTLNKLKDYELIMVESINNTNSKELVKMIRFINKSESTVLGTVVEVK